MRLIASLARCLLLLVVIAIMVPPAMIAVAQSQADADAAIADAVFISELEASKNADELYEWIHPDARNRIPKSAVVGWYTTDFFPLEPQPISEITGIQFIDWVWPVTGKTYRNTAEISFIQPFGLGANQTYQHETVRLVESGGKWRWFFGRSAEFVESQVARFPEPSQPEQSSARNTGSGTTSGRSGSSETSRLSRNASGCTLVELFPGYPGYRGVVTGMLPAWGGLGNWACLETLESQNPSFDKARVDAANIAAARELGINGSPEDWVWENWMQIEAVSGRTPTCYSCILSDPTIAPINTSVLVDSHDPRVRLGWWLKGGDYRVRAAAFILSSPDIPNAPELLEDLPEAFDSILYWEPVFDFVISTGGYTWVPPNARSWDQHFLFSEALYTSVASVPPPVFFAYLSIFNQQSLDWRTQVLTGPNPPTLREYIEQNWP